MEAKEIFISYKSEEFDDALWVKNTLESNGISCWMAPMCISGGASYATEIPNAIKNCKILVLILSETAQESKWIPRELDQAINSDKLIMPFMLENCALKNDFEFYLSNVQRYSAYLDKEGTMDKMLEDIRNYLGYAAPEIAPIPEAPAQELPQPEPPIAPPSADVQPSQKAAPSAAIKKPAKPVKKSKAKNAKKSGMLVGIIAAAVVAVIASAVLLSQTQKKTIADTVFNKNDYSVHIDGKEIDAADMKVLSEFKDLSYVEFTNCTFSTDNLGAIANHELISLVLENCRLTDAQLGSIDFKALETLRELNLNGNKQLTDLTVLSPLADSLDALYINNTSPASLDFIKDFTNIKRFSMNQVGLSDLGIVSEMAYLEELYADGNNIETLDGLKNATVLRKVSLNNNRLSDVSILANSAATLTALQLDNNEISDLSVLADCTNIVDFSANANQLTSVEWLAGWKALDALSLANNKIETMENFVQSESLTTIDMSHNKLTKIGEIAFKNDGYITANFSNNAITAVALKPNCHFVKFALHGNPLKDAAFLTQIKGSDITLDYFDELDAASLKEAGFYHLYIADCPTNRKVELESASYKVKLTTSAEIDAVLSE